MPADLYLESGALDDCWNRIGIRGDQTCERLQEHVHCRNCEVYAQAAATLLDRIASNENDLPDMLGEVDQTPSLDGGRHAGRTSSASGMAASSGISNVSNLSADEGEPLLLFRVADEWMALPARFIAQVAQTSPIHTLPKLRGRAVVGLANVRGQLTVCVSLARLLDLNETDGADAAAGAGNLASAVSLTQGATAEIGQRAAIARFLVTRDSSPDRSRDRRADETTVFPVDEVFGIVRFGRDEHRPVPATLAHATAVHTRSLIAWRGKSVGVLDSSSLFETLRRSLG